MLGLELNGMMNPDRKLWNDQIAKILTDDSLALIRIDRELERADVQSELFGDEEGVYFPDYLRQKLEGHTQGDELDTLLDVWKQGALQNTADFFSFHTDFPGFSRAVMRVLFRNEKWILLILQSEPEGSLREGERRVYIAEYLLAQRQLRCLYSATEFRKALGETGTVVPADQATELFDVSFRKMEESVNRAVETGESHLSSMTGFWMDFQWKPDRPDRVLATVSCSRSKECDSPDALPGAEPRSGENRKWTVTNGTSVYMMQLNWEIILPIEAAVFGTRADTDYEGIEDQLIERWADDGERKKMKKELSPDRIRERLHTVRAYEVRFIGSAEQGGRMCSLWVMRADSPEWSDSVFLVFSNRGERPGGWSERQEMLEALNREYDCVLYMDDTGKQRVCQLSDFFLKQMKRPNAWKDAEVCLNSLTREIVHPDDEGLFRMRMRREAIQARLQNRPLDAFRFRILLNGQTAYYEARMTKTLTEGVVIGIRGIDAETRMEMELNRYLEKTVSQRTSELTEKNRKLNRINNGIVEILGIITEARDNDSGQHVHRIKTFTHILAEQYMKDFPESGLTQDKVDMIATASAMHDVGKIMIPDVILLKPARLTREERAVMKSHCMRGCEILQSVPQEWSEDFFRYAMEICRWHHERVDGRGYPDGLRGDQIPLSAQIVSIADCYDALVCKRVYKEAYTPNQAYDMIRGGECGVFSNNMLRALEACIGQFEACVRAMQRDIRDADSDEDMDFVNL